MTSHDVETALEVIDWLPEAEVQRIRASLVAGAAAMRAGKATPGAGAAPTPDPFFAACAFVLYYSSDESLERSL